MHAGKILGLLICHNGRIEINFLFSCQASLLWSAWQMTSRMKKCAKFTISFQCLFTQKPKLVSYECFCWPLFIMTNCLKSPFFVYDLMKWQLTDEKKSLAKRIQLFTADLSTSVFLHESITAFVNYGLQLVGSPPYLLDMPLVSALHPSHFIDSNLV